MVPVLLALTLQAQAAPPPVPPAGQVEVVGARAAPVSGREASRVVRGLAAPTLAHGQLARWADPVCPAVEGLPEPYAGLMVRRLREIGAEAGAPLDREGCAPNALVLVTPDIDRLAASLARRERILTGPFESPPQARRFLRERRPVIGWQVTDERPYGGEAPSNAGEPDAVPIDQWSRASRLQSEIQDVVAHAVVIVDTQATQGRNLAQVTAYVAMALFAGITPRARVEAPSILQLFDAPPPADVERLGLTAWDRAYLRALYHTRPDRPAWEQEGDMAHEIARALNGDAPRAAGRR